MLLKKICCFSATCMTVGSSCAVASYLNSSDKPKAVKLDLKSIDKESLISWSGDDWKGYGGESEGGLI